jgi:branched-subunit amino acid permease
MLSALCPIVGKELNSMTTLLHNKSQSIRGRTPGSELMAKGPEDHALALLCFTTANGLLSFVAAMFTTMLPFPARWRYFWLVICLVAFGLSLVGIILFRLSYKENNAVRVQ